MQWAAVAVGEHVPGVLPSAASGVAFLVLAAGLFAQHGDAVPVRCSCVVRSGGRLDPFPWSDRKMQSGTGERQHRLSGGVEAELGSGERDHR